MTHRDMTDLIIAYDGLRELESALTILTGSDTPLMYDEGAAGNLSRLQEVIRRNAYADATGGDADDYAASDLAKILDDPSLTPDERAKRLMERPRKAQ